MRGSPRRKAGRDRTLKALARVPGLLSAILDVTGALVVALDPEGRIVLFNRACERVTGFASRDVAGSYVWDRLLLPEEAESVKAVFADLRAGRFPNEHENYWVAKDGTRRYICWSNTALLAEDGSVRLVIGTGIDITERKRVEAALRESEERLRGILNTAAEGIVTIDEQGHIRSFNLAAEWIFGCSAQETIGKNVKMLMPPPYRDEHDDYLRRYRETGQRRIIGTHREVTGQRKDGSTFPMTLAVSEYHDGKGPRFTGIVRDITEQKRAEAALSESEQRFRSLVETAGNAIIVLSPEGRIHEWNEEAERIYGYTRNEVLGEDYFERFLPTECRAAVAADMKQVLEGKRTVGFENAVLCRDGRRRDMLWNVSRLVDAEARPTAVLAIGQDVTDRKRTEQEIQRRLAELARVSRVNAVGEMASGLAHEINQPLAAIVSYADACLLMLQSGRGKPATVQESLTAISEQARRAGDIIGRLRQFITRGKTEHRRGDINDVVREVLALLRYEINEHGIRLALDLGEDLPQVEIDKVQIEQVIVNLVRNAIDAMGGPQADQRLLTICTARAEGRRPALEVVVSDRGEGLKSEEADQVFDAFYSTKPNGMGLGLAISRSIIQAHGGELWAARNLGRGTTFRFSLPVHEADSNRE